MNKIKTIKIKNEDGSVSEESYTIAADAINIDMNNGKNLQETVGNIEVDTDGSIASQLNNRIKKNDIVDNLNSTDNNKVLSAKQGKVLGDAVTALNTNINKKTYYFNTVAEMKSANLKENDVCQTLGYYEVNDGGAGLYQIIAAPLASVDEGSYITLSNNYIAKLVINDSVNVKQFGAKCDGITDDSDILLKALNNFSIIEFPANSTIVFNKRFSVNKNTTIKGNFATLLITDAEEYNVRYKAFELLNNKLLKIDDLNINASFPANSFSSWDWTLFFGTNGKIELNNVNATIDGGTTNRVNGLFIYGESKSVICNNSCIDVKAIGLPGGCCWLRSGTGNINAEFNNTIFKQNSVDEVFGTFGNFENIATLNKCRLIRYGTSEANQLVTSYIQANNAKLETIYKECYFEGSEDANITNVLFMENNNTTNVSNRVYLEKCNFKIPSCTSFFGGGLVGTYSDIEDFKNKLKLEINDSSVSIKSGSIHITGFPINVNAKKCEFNVNDREFTVLEVSNIYPYEEIYEECIFKRIGDNTPTDFIQYIEAQGIVQKFKNCIQEKDYIYQVSSNAQVTQAFSNDYFIELLNYRLFSDLDKIKSKRIPRSANSPNISITPTASTGTILNNKSFYNVEQRVVFLDFQLNVGNTTTDTVDINYSPSTSMSYGAISCMGYADNKYTPIGNLVTGGLLKIYTVGYAVVRVCGYLPY